MRTNRWLLALSVLLCIALTSCGAPSAGPGQPKTIKVGALYPLSGELAQIGDNVRNGLVLAVEDINAAGGIRSMGGAKIELVFGDTQGKPDVGVSEVDRLVQQEGVVAIIGCYQSAVTIPATQEAERLQVPFIVDIAVANKITERGFRWVFRVGPKADSYAADQVAFLKDLPSLGGPEIRKVALLHEDTDWGQSTAEAQKRFLKEAGIEVLTEVTYPANAADLTTEVSKAAATNPDAILTVTYLNDAVLITQAREKLGLKNILFMDTAGGTIDPEYIQRLGSAADGMLTVVEFSKFAKGSAELNERYRARFGEDMTGNSVHSYQAGLVLADALERAGTTEKNALRDAIARTDMSGEKVVLPSGRVQFGEDGQNKFARLYVVQIQKGELMPVWPPAVATAKIQFGQ